MGRNPAGQEASPDRKAPGAETGGSKVQDLLGATHTATGAARPSVATGPDSLELELENLMDEEFARREGYEADSLEMELEHLMDEHFQQQGGHF